LIELGTIDKAITEDFGLASTDLEFLDEEFGPLVSDFPASKDVDVGGLVQLYLSEKDQLTRMAMEAVGARRFTAKKMYWVSRRIELLSRIFSAHPSLLVRLLAEQDICNLSDLREMALLVVSWIVGVVFGRWDARYMTGEKELPKHQDLFEPLPVCAPAMLQNEQGLPATKIDYLRLREMGQWNYLIEVPWDGILVDDPGHPLNIDGHIRNVVERVWRERADEIEQEACGILGHGTLKEYLRKPSGFFADHLQTYSKSRRQAPVYWPLSTASESFIIWLYYPRLTAQTLHTCLADVLDPKLRSLAVDIRSLRNGKGTQQRLEELLDFEQELIEMRSEIERVIKLPYEPNLNDGVWITACPLWKLFRLPKWQKDLREFWDDLERGENDWAHLAYSIWPDRVREKCRSDRSIAVAHGLEDLCVTALAKVKKGRKKTVNLVEEKTF
jgi:hypothetical protein